VKGILAGVLAGALVFAAIIRSLKVNHGSAVKK
jgi:hypothetical protein